jgi:hypothetical protein
MTRILRASTSLEFPDFRAWIVRHFNERWSDNLSNLTTERLENAAETISLARQYDVPGVLKRAFYEVIRTPGFGKSGLGDSEYVEGGEGEGGSDEEEGSEDGSSDEEEGSGEGSDEEEGNEGGGNVKKQSTDEKNGDGDGSDEDEAVMTDGSDDTTDSSVTDGTVDGKDDYPIPHEDILRLTNAREHLTTAWVLAAASVPTSSTCHYKNIRACMRAPLWTKLVHTSGIFVDYLYDPICGLDALMDIDWKSEGLCPNCVEVRLDVWGKQRQNLWDNLDLWLEV